MFETDISIPVNFLIVTFSFFVIITGRYLLIAGLFHSYFYKLRAQHFEKQKVNKRSYSTSQFRKEIGWSMLSAFVFAVAGSFTLLFWQKGWLKVYIQLNEYGYLYLPLSLFISMLLHEAYYYFLHRWMHHPKIFRWIHKIHHDSNITSVWTAFSFHPAEALIQAVFLPALLLLLPINVYVLLIHLTVMTISSVINHLNIEIYPANFHHHWFGKWWIGATHHALHHKQFRYNYGLYFTFMDKWYKTESPLYEQAVTKTLQKATDKKE